MAGDLENENENENEHNNPEPEKEEKKEEEEEDLTRTKNVSGLLATIPTKKTPVISLSFTRRNLLLAAGPYRRNLEVINKK